MANIGQTVYLRRTTNGIDNYFAEPYAGNIPWGAVDVGKEGYIQGLRQKQQAVQDYLSLPLQGNGRMLPSGANYVGQTYQPGDIQGYQSLIDAAQAGSGANAPGYQAPGMYSGPKTADNAVGLYSTPQGGQDPNELAVAAGTMKKIPIGNGWGYIPTGSAADLNPVGSLKPAQAPTTAGAVNTVGSMQMAQNAPTFGNINNANASASGVQSWVDTQSQIAKDRATQVQQEQAQLAASTKPFLDKFLGSSSPTEARTQAQAQTGIDPANYFADQKAKIAEINTLTTNYNAAKSTMEQQIAGTQDKMGSMNFINNQTAQIQRNAAPMLNEMSANINAKAAELQALQGNFNVAQSFINQAVQDATATQKYNYDLYTTLYNTNKDIIDSLDAPYKVAYENGLKMAGSKYEQAVKDASAAGDAAMKFNSLGAGILVTDSPAEVARKVSSVGGDLAYYNAQQKAQFSNSKSGTDTVVTPAAISYIQQNIDAGLDVPSAVESVVKYYQNELGVNVTEAMINQWTSEAKKLKKTPTPPAPIGPVQEQPTSGGFWSNLLKPRSNQTPTTTTDYRQNVVNAYQGYTPPDTSSAGSFLSSLFSR